MSRAEKRMSIEIIEVLRRSEQGMTRPFICRGDDNEIYFVKGLDAGRRSQICEWVAGRLAELIGLPIAPYKIVDVPDELIEAGFLHDIKDLGAGPAFGSMQRQVTEINYSGIEQVPPSLQQDVLMFDWWVKNGDRCLSEKGGNPNLFWESCRQELVVIDHNQAFDFSCHKHDFSDFHVFNSQTQQLAADFFRRYEYHRRFSAALNHWDSIIAEIPDSWWFVDAEMTVAVDFEPDTVFELLNRYQQEAFWNWR